MSVPNEPQPQPLASEAADPTSVLAPVPGKKQLSEAQKAGLAKAREKAREKKLAISKQKQEDEAAVATVFKMESDKIDANIAAETEAAQASFLAKQSSNDILRRHL